MKRGDYLPAVTWKKLSGRVAGGSWAVGFPVVRSFAVSRPSLWASPTSSSNCSRILLFAVIQLT